jgi:hypothetical protein
MRLRLVAVLAAAGCLAAIVAADAAGAPAGGAAGAPAGGAAGAPGGAEAIASAGGAAGAPGGAEAVAPAGGAAGVSPGGAASAPAGGAEGEATLQTQESAWDVYSAEGQKVGRMHLKVMTVRDLVVIDEGLSVTLDGKENAFDNQVVYNFKAGDQPRVTRARVATRIGNLKTMDAKLEFTEGTVKVAASGYVGQDMKPLLKAVEEAKDTPLPPGLVLTYPAFVYFAPRLLADTGRIPNVSYMKFPASLIFPGVLAFDGDSVLTRAPAGGDGRTEFSLHRILAGGNIELRCAMTVDKAGKVQELRLKGFTFRPEGSKPPAASPSPVPPGPGPKK